MYRKFWLVSLFVCLANVGIAQTASIEGVWFLAFINEVHIDTGKSYTINIKKKGGSYMVNHPGKSCRYLPPQGDYGGDVYTLENKGAVLNRIQSCIKYVVRDTIVEFRMLKNDSVMGVYVHLAATFLEKSATTKSKELEYLKTSIDYSRKGIVLEPYCVECYFNLSLAMHKLGLADSAAYYAEETKRINPNFPNLDQLYDAVCSLYLTYAWDEYGKKGRYTETVEVYKRALAFDSQNADFWYNMGGAYYADKQYNEAVAAFRQAKVLDPENEKIQQGLDAAIENAGK